MKSMNEVFLLGHVGRDPEVTRTASGKARASFSLATRYAVRGEDGWEERTDWHKVVVFDWQAQRVEAHLRKGDPLVVRGRMSSHRYTDPGGQKRTSWSVVARDLRFLTSRREGSLGPPVTEAPAVGAALPPPSLTPGSSRSGSGVPF